MTNFTRGFVPKFVCAIALTFAMCVASSVSIAQTATSSSSQNTNDRQVGTVKTITGTEIKLTTDSGTETTVLISEGSRLVRIDPGQKDLSGAIAIKLEEIQPGDRLLVRGKPSGERTLAASLVVAMKSSDIAKKQQLEREDWQKRGIGGTVQAIDANTGAVKIATVAAGADKAILVRIGKTAIVRRYAADSVKFDDATRSTIEEIKPEDQLRARGARSADGSEFLAEEVVSGTFRNVAGTVMAVDAATGTLKVMDLATKKPVSVRITADSHMHKLPPMVAYRIAARLKGTPTAAPEGAGPHGVTSPAANSSGAPKRAGSSGEVPVADGAHRSGPADVQQILNTMPAATLTDLQKNDAVMMVTTLGSAGGDPAVIMLLSGVEPILTASPNGSRAAMLLSPWNLASGGEGDAQ